MNFNMNRFRMKQRLIRQIKRNIIFKVTSRLKRLWSLKKKVMKMSLQSPLLRYLLHQKNAKFSKIICLRAIQISLTPFINVSHTKKPMVSLEL